MIIIFCLVCVLLQETSSHVLLQAEKKYDVYLFSFIDVNKLDSTFSEKKKSCVAYLKNNQIFDNNILSY